MSESRKKLKEEHKLTVGEARKWATKDTSLSGMASIEEIQRKEQEVKDKIKRKQEEIKRKKEATREEQKRMIYREVGTLKAMADDEGKAANRYRDAAKDSPLPTMSKVLFSIASDEQAHEQRLRMLAVELERGIL